jgi:hypothetical protein
MWKIGERKRYSSRRGGNDTEYGDCFILSFATFQHTAMCAKQMCSRIDKKFQKQKYKTEY